MNKENSNSNMKSLRAFFSGKGKGKKEDVLGASVIAKKAPLQAASTLTAAPAPAAAAVPVPASEIDEESKQEPAVVIEAVLPSVALDADAASASSISAAASPAPSCITTAAGSPPYAFAEAEMAQNSPVIETHPVSQEPVHASGVDTPVPDRRSEMPNAMLTPQRTSKKIKATDVALFDQQQQQQQMATSEHAPNWKKPLLALAAFALLLLISCSSFLLPSFTSSFAPQIITNKPSVLPPSTSSFSFLPSSSSSSPAAVVTYSSASTSSYPFESTRIVANVKLRVTKLINNVFFAPLNALKATWSALTSRLKRAFGNNK